MMLLPEEAKRECCLYPEREKPLSICSTGAGHMRQWFKALRAYEMMVAHEATRGARYAIVAKARVDIVPTLPFDLRQLLGPTATAPPAAAASEAMVAGDDPRRWPTSSDDPPAFYSFTDWFLAGGRFAAEAYFKGVAEGGIWFLGGEDIKHRPFDARAFLATLRCNSPIDLDPFGHPRWELRNKIWALPHSRGEGHGEDGPRGKTARVLEAFLGSGGVKGGEGGNLSAGVPAAGRIFRSGDHGLEDPANWNTLNLKSERDWLHFALVRGVAACELPPFAPTIWRAKERTICKVPDCQTCWCKVGKATVKPTATVGSAKPAAARKKSPKKVKTGH